MCGIAGLVYSPADHVDRHQVRRLLETLEHRGPDDWGVLYANGTSVNSGRELLEDTLAEVVLAHRRLSILDLSEAGRQPMSTCDGRYYIIFNGEIYNYLELRGELESFGYSFRSRSDTEVLLAAYRHWGAAALNRLVGMFAFAILDTDSRRLFLARDCFGIKPLYYTFWRGGLAFASEIKTIIELPGVSRSVNPSRLYDFLRFGITDIRGETLLSDIRQVPAAHCMDVSLADPSSARPVRYWELDLSQRCGLSFEDSARKLRELFLDSVLLHLRSDVPVGVTLSGGIDSSAILMAVQRLGRNSDIHTVSFIADDERVSEERWVDLVASAAGARVHKVRGSSSLLIQEVDSLVNVQEESFGGTSIFAQHLVFQSARQAGIKVMLDGQGADELLAGYHYYIAARLGTLVRQGRWSQALKLSHKASIRTGLSGASIWMRAMDFLLPPALQKPLRRSIHKDLDPRWMNASWFEKNGIRPRSVGYREGDEVLRESLFSDFVENSLPRLLRFEDRNSMASSIESRVPFLTPGLVQFVFSLPEEYLISDNGTTKAVFRRAMRGIVPDCVLDRTDKVGFATPERDWLLTLRPWVDRIISSESAAEVRAIDVGEVRSEWARIIDGRVAFDSRVWRWVSMILWARRFGVQFA